MGTLFSGEYRRAAMMGVVGAPVIVALLMLRLFAGGDGGAASTAVGPAVPASVPLSGGTLPTAPVPAPVPPVPVDPALLRNPFCPLVAAPAAAGSAPVTCERPTAPAGHQVVELVDIFEEGGVRLARMRVGQFTFSNVHQGDVVADCCGLSPSPNAAATLNLRRLPCRFVRASRCSGDCLFVVFQTPFTCNSRTLDTVFSDSAFVPTRSKAAGVSPPWRRRSSLPPSPPAARIGSRAAGGAASGHR